MNNCKKIYVLFLFVFLLENVFAADMDTRTLVKIPFKDREEVLMGMRKYLKLTEKILNEISNKNYANMEVLISKIQMDSDRLYRLSKRENLAFMELAYKFHSEEVENVKIAAMEKDQGKAVRAMSKFIGSCNFCHDRFRLIEWSGQNYSEPNSNKKFIEKYINKIKK